MQFKVTVTRLVEEECVFFVDARDEFAAEDKTHEILDYDCVLGYGKELVWIRTNTAPIEQIDDIERVQCE
jgi:hypothetical protein